jgi:hypothetical protein
MNEKGDQASLEKKLDGFLKTTVAGWDIAPHPLAIQHRQKYLSVALSSSFLSLWRFNPFALSSPLPGGAAWGAISCQLATLFLVNFNT